MCPRDLIPFAILLALGPVSGVTAQVREPSAEVRQPVEAPIQPSEQPAISQRERRVVIDAPKGGADSLRITDLDGTEITDEVRVREDPDGRVNLTVPDRRAIVIKGRGIETVRAMSNEPLVLPDGLFLMERGDGSGSGSAEGQEPDAGGLGPPDSTATGWLRLTLTPSPMPAPWNSEAGSYATELSFGVHPTNGVSDRSIDLGHPVDVRLSLQGLRTEQTLQPMRIEATGLAHEQTVPLRFIPTTPNPTLQVRSTISDVNVVLEALPRIEVRPESTSMMGLGLDRMDVSVQRVTPHGMPLRQDHPVDVLVTLTGGGRIEAGPQRIDADDSQTRLGLRSSGWGSLKVAAAAGGLSGAAVIEQRVPWVPVGAALIGGAIGGYTRRFVKGAKQALAGRRVAEGIVVATVAYVAAVLGVGYLGLPAVVAATEAGAFLTGALTGFIGVSVLETLAKPGEVAAR